LQEKIKFQMKIKRIALLTSGGDAPGMNACVRAIVKSALNNGIDVYGVEDGYQGMIEGRIRKMDYSDVDNIIQYGGTVLGTVRSKDFLTIEGRQKAISNLNELKIDGLIVIGGDGSFAGANQLSKEMDIAIIGIPGTIDNDIFGTDHTIGYDTALNTVVEAVDKIRDTATSHHRIFFVEVMGRDAGFIALNSAIASGAEAVLIPEEISDIEELVKNIKSSNKGKRSTIIIVAEGDDAGGAKEILEKVRPYLANYELRYSILGHIQRGGSPTVKDRIIATQMGVKAVKLLLSGKSKLMVGVEGDDLVTHSIEKTIKQHSKPDVNKLNLLESLRTRF
jgi:6-phosphofructokinase 1